MNRTVEQTEKKWEYFKFGRKVSFTTVCTNDKECGSKAVFDSHESNVEHSVKLTYSDDPIEGETVRTSVTFGYADEMKEWLQEKVAEESKPSDLFLSFMVEAYKEYKAFKYREDNRVSNVE